MKYESAKRLVSVDINGLTLEGVQRHKVRLLDAWRESNGEYGVEQAYRNGFLVPVVDSSASGWAPRDIFLTENLRAAFDRAVQKEKELLQETPL